MRKIELSFGGSTFVVAFAPFRFDVHGLWQSQQREIESIEIDKLLKKNDSKLT